MRKLGFGKYNHESLENIRYTYVLGLFAHSE